MQTLTLIKPDDCHIHLRDDEYLATTVPAAAKQFARAVVMPNLATPITDVAAADSYRQRILTQIPVEEKFQPLMTLYLTDQTSAHTVKRAKEAEFIIGFKFYPAGVTTHSIAGITALEKIYPALEAMEICNMPLLVHGEACNKEIDIFDREKSFLDHELTTIAQRFPNLRIVVEHISTEVAVNWVKSAGKNIAATITAHHLLFNRNDLLMGGIRPHLYCMPILKTQQDQQALIAAATSGNPKFFLGTDSAPHSQSNKENVCGAAGIYTAHAALEFYAEVFEQANALDKLEAFSSFFGADFYNLTRNQQTITLSKQTWKIPETFAFGKNKLIPLRAGQTLEWKISR